MGHLPVRFNINYCLRKIWRIRCLTHLVVIERTPLATPGQPQGSRHPLTTNPCPYNDSEPVTEPLRGHCKGGGGCGRGEGTLVVALSLGYALDCLITPLPQHPRLPSSLVKVPQVNRLSRKENLRLHFLHDRFRSSSSFPAQLLKFRQPHRCRKSLLFRCHLGLAA